MPDNSVAVERPQVLVIQPGSELECAMTRGWIDALQKTAETDIVAKNDYAEILDIYADPTHYYPLHHNPLDLVRTRRLLRQRDFEQVLCLSNTMASRFLSSACHAKKRIRTQIGPPGYPSEIDSVLAVLFGRLGIEAPDRGKPLVLTSRTIKAADALLLDFGFDSEDCPTMVAPRADTETALSANWHMTLGRAANRLPVIILPAGQEIEFIGTLVGKAFFVPTPSVELRAALIQRASRLFSNDPLSIELAALMQTPVTEFNGDVKT